MAEGDSEQQPVFEKKPVQETAEAARARIVELRPDYEMASRQYQENYARTHQHNPEAAQILKTQAFELLNNARIAEPEEIKNAPDVGPNVQKGDGFYYDRDTGFKFSLSMDLGDLKGVISPSNMEEAVYLADTIGAKIDFTHDSIGGAVRTAILKHPPEWVNRVFTKMEEQGTEISPVFRGKPS